MKLSSLIGHVTELTQEIDRMERPADRLIDLFFRGRKYLGSKDRRFISETVYGMLRHRIRIEWGIAAAGVKDSPLYQCLTYLLLDHKMSIQQISAEVNVPEEELSALERNVNSEPAFPSERATMSVKYSFPEWMLEEWEKTTGKEQLGELCAVLNTQAPMTMRVNTIKISRDACQQRLNEEGVETEQTALSPFGLNLKRRINLFQLQSFKDGMFEVQDEGSQLLALLVDPKPKSKVIDACAGAGGKALALASLMENRGEIFALDTHSFRLDELQKRVRRDGVDTIRTSVIRENEPIEKFVGSADYVLVDAPCTGTGTIRRNPGMKWTVSQKMVEELCEKQYSILDLNSAYVKPGGRLVYATCSLIQRENQDVVERFLAAHPEFELVEPATVLARYDLSHIARGKYFQLLPHQNNTDGFFAAVLKRKNP
ncbi:MAG: class I SAM-dependent methyltransferase [Bacteroidetes bacterium]|nr:class I SAM-dependent methyltransferase [Bacteroidota bacterium]